MKLHKLIKQLQKIEKDILDSGGSAMSSNVSVEAIDDNGDVYYEDNFNMFIDDNNDIGLSPINK